MTESYHKIEDTERLDEHGSRVIIEQNGIEVVVVNVEGDYYALPNYCPHVGGPLGRGALTGHTHVDDGEIVYEETEKIIECPWHCWRFDVTTGKNIDDSRYELPTFDVWEEDGDVYVDL